MIGGFVTSFSPSSGAPALVSRTASPSACALLVLAVAVVAQSPPRSNEYERARADSASPQNPSNDARLELNKRLEAARVARASGDPARVSDASEKVIALALRELAHLRLLEGAFPQAIELYHRSLDFEDIPDTHVDLSIALLAGNDPDAALTQANGVLATRSDDERALTVLGSALLLKQDYAMAVKPLSRVADLDPSLDSYYSLAVCLLNSHDPKDNARAPQVFDQMIKLVGDSGSIHVIIGRAYRDANNMLAAIREFQRAIAIDPRTPHAHYFLGLARLAANEWSPTPEVYAEFAKELQLDPRDYLANYMTGFVDSSGHKYAQAEPFLKLAAQVDPTAPEPWLYLGLDSYAQGDNQSAEADFRKAILLTGSDEARNNFQIRRAYIDLGRILITSGRKEEAEKILAKARDLQNKVLEMSQQQMGAHLLQGGAGAAAVVQPLSSEAERQAAPLSNAPVSLFAQVDASTLAHAGLSQDQKHRAALQEKSLRTILAISFNDLGTSEAIAKIYRSAEGHFQEAERWDPQIPGLNRNQ